MIQCENVFYLHCQNTVSDNRYIFFLKQKMEYEMRISDWSSDVCSSDLFPCRCRTHGWRFGQGGGSSWALISGRAGRGAPCIGGAPRPCNQMSSASDPTSNAAIVQLKTRRRAGLDNQPRSAWPIPAPSDPKLPRLNSRPYCHYRVP